MKEDATESGLHTRQDPSEAQIVIKTKIEFETAWSRLEVQDFLERLFNDDNVSDIGMAMSIIPESKPEPTQPVSSVTPDNKPGTVQKEADPSTFSEIEPIAGADLSHVMGTSKPILTYAETKDGRVAIYYNEAATYTTLDTIRALPAKIPASMLVNMHVGKRAAIRGFKAWLIKEDTIKESDNTDVKTMYDTGLLDPYEPVLTGGAKTDTHASGKVEGDLE